MEHFTKKKIDRWSLNSGGKLLFQTLRQGKTESLTKIFTKFNYSPIVSYKRCRSILPSHLALSVFTNDQILLQNYLTICWYTHKKNQATARSKNQFYQWNERLTTSVITFLLREKKNLFAKMKNFSKNYLNWCRVSWLKWKFCIMPPKPHRYPINT